MQHYLSLTRYAEDDALHRSDQIMVPAALWRECDRNHVGNGPIFIEISQSGSRTGVVGRLRPAVPTDGLGEDTCRLPTWMTHLVGFDQQEQDWVCITVVERPPTATTIVLRARQEATVTGSTDSVAMLTAELSGSGGGPSWACLSLGMELPLACGTFDVMNLEPEGANVCILDCDVNLEFVPALDRPSEPEREEMVATATATATATGGFVPFSGKGQRLGR